MHKASKKFKRQSSKVIYTYNKLLRNIQLDTKYDVNNNHEGEYKSRLVKMHLKLRDQQLKNNVYIETIIQKPHGNHRTKIHNRYANTKEKGIQT